MPVWQLLLGLLVLPALGSCSMQPQEPPSSLSYQFGHVYTQVWRVKTGTTAHVPVLLPLRVPDGPAFTVGLRQPVELPHGGYLGWYAGRTEEYRASQELTAYGDVTFAYSLSTDLRTSDRSREQGVFLSVPRASDASPDATLDVLVTVRFGSVFESVPGFHVDRHKNATVPRVPDIIAGWLVRDRFAGVWTPTAIGMHLALGIYDERSSPSSVRMRRGQAGAEMVVADGTCIGLAVDPSFPHPFQLLEGAVATGQSRCGDAQCDVWTHSQDGRRQQWCLILNHELCWYRRYDSDGVLEADWLISADALIRTQSLLLQPLSPLRESAGTGYCTTDCGPWGVCITDAHNDEGLCACASDQFTGPACRTFTGCGRCVHGTCSDPTLTLGLAARGPVVSHCRCSDGWEGPACDQPVCQMNCSPGLVCSDDHVCSACAASALAPPYCRDSACGDSQCDAGQVCVGHHRCGCPPMFSGPGCAHAPPSSKVLLIDDRVLAGAADTDARDVVRVSAAPAIISAADGPHHYLLNVSTSDPLSNVEFSSQHASHIGRASATRVYVGQERLPTPGDRLWDTTFLLPGIYYVSVFHNNQSMIDEMYWLSVSVPSSKSDAISSVLMYVLSILWALSLASIACTLYTDASFARKFRPSEPSLMDMSYEDPLASGVGSVDAPLLQTPQRRGRKQGRRRGKSSPPS